MKYIYKILSLIATIVLLQSCDEPDIREEQSEQTVKIAVVLCDDSYDRWKRIMDLAQKNIREATNINPVFEFYDEDGHDLMILAYELARDESIACVIGCESEANTDIFAVDVAHDIQHKPCAIAV